MYNLIHFIKERYTDDYLIEESSIITFINPYSYLQLRKHPELIKQFSKIMIDGEWLCKFLRMFAKLDCKRRSFDTSSIAPLVFSEVEKNSKSLYLIGSKQKEIDEAVLQIKTRWENLNIIGYRHGYFNSEQERKNTLIELSHMSPDLVVVGMGAIIQEQFLVDLKLLGWKGSGYTCGGFLHQTAKKIDYYPYIFDKLNLRWVYRIYDEPKLLRRYLIQYPVFVVVFFYDLFKNKG